MISTYVRRLRLAGELKALRKQRALSSDELANQAGISRSKVSRLENARTRPDPDDVMRILEALGITGSGWTTLMDITRQASERGWWETTADEMGPRQALYANLEAGAAAITEYQMTLLPGLLQTPQFAAARAKGDSADWSSHFDAAAAVQARTGRQRVLHRPDGPQYEVIVDALAIRRPAAKAQVFHDQLVHLAELARNNARITVRVLPIDARIREHAVPRSSFSIYTYPDPADPTVVAVDTVTDDLVLTEVAPVAHYLGLYQRLQQAALDPDASVQFITEAADRIPHRTRRAA